MKITCLYCSCGRIHVIAKQGRGKAVAFEVGRKSAGGYLITGAGGEWHAPNVDYALAFIQRGEWEGEYEPS